MTIEVLDHGYVKLVEKWGSDQSIIEAARMSTQKGFLGWGGVEPCTAGCDDGLIVSTDDSCCMDHCPKCGGTGKVLGDEKLFDQILNLHVFS